MLTEAEAKHLSVSSSGKGQNIPNESVKQLINTREPCSGNTALHWAAKYGVICINQ